MRSNVAARKTRIYWKTISFRWRSFSKNNGDGFSCLFVCFFFLCRREIKENNNWKLNQSSTMSLRNQRAPTGQHHQTTKRYNSTSHSDSWRQAWTTDVDSCEAGATLACWVDCSRSVVYDPSLFGAEVSVVRSRLWVLAGLFPSLRTGPTRTFPVCCMAGLGRFPPRRKTSLRPTLMPFPIVCSVGELHSRLDGQCQAIVDVHLGLGRDGTWQFFGRQVLNTVLDNQDIGLVNGLGHIIPTSSVDYLPALPQPQTADSTPRLHVTLGQLSLISSLRPSYVCS